MILLRVLTALITSFAFSLDVVRNETSNTLHIGGASHQNVNTYIGTNSAAGKDKTTDSSDSTREEKKNLSTRKDYTTGAGNHFTFHREVNNANFGDLIGKRSNVNFGSRTNEDSSLVPVTMTPPQSSFSFTPRPSFVGATAPAEWRKTMSETHADDDDYNDETEEMTEGKRLPPNL